MNTLYNSVNNFTVNNSDELTNLLGVISIFNNFRHLINAIESNPIPNNSVSSNARYSRIVSSTAMITFSIFYMFTSLASKQHDASILITFNLFRSLTEDLGRMRDSDQLKMNSLIVLSLFMINPSEFRLFKFIANDLETKAIYNNLSNAFSIYGTVLSNAPVQSNPKNLSTTNAIEAYLYEWFSNFPVGVVGILGVVNSINCFSKINAYTIDNINNENAKNSLIPFIFSLTSLSVSLIAALCPTSQMSILAISATNLISYYSAQSLQPPIMVNAPAVQPIPRLLYQAPNPQIVRQVINIDYSQHYLNIFSQAVNGREGVNDAEREAFRQSIRNSVNVIVNLPDAVREAVLNAIAQQRDNVEGQAPARG